MKVAESEVSTILATISKVCDLPDHDEKWALLKTLNEVLTFAAYPAIFVGENA